MREFLSTCSTTIARSVVITALIVAVVGVTHGQVMSSTNYQLESDSINVGGGLSSSTNYVQESTVGEIATGRSTSTTYQLRAGYQQMQESYISVAVTGDVTMDTNLPGITGGTSNGSTTVTVITDNGPGYQLTIEASNNPAMKRNNGSETIADYTPVGAVPDFTFLTVAGDAHLGYSPDGVDITQRFLHTAGNVCGSGSNNTNLSCWDRLSTTAVAIAEASSANQPAGATTTVHFRVGLGSGAGVIAGDYKATSTVTALPL